MVLLALGIALVACANSAEQVSVHTLDLSGRNVLLVTIDTLRADHLGAYGFVDGETPTLDRLAREGVTFDHAFTSVPLTLPAHTNLFTGRYPPSTGVRINGTSHVLENEITLAELLETAGYDTYAAVSAFVLAAKFGLDQGFATYDDSLGSEQLLQAVENQIPGELVYRKFARWLAERRRAPEPRRQFFTWLHFYDPHLPHEPPSPFRERFAADLYSGEIAYVDSLLGRVVDDLKQASEYEKTIFVITSDHGEAFGEHVEEGHGLLCYNETLHVPLIVAAPGALPTGTRVSNRVRLIDIMPTLLDWLGVDPPAALEGRSFAGLLSGQQESGERTLYFESLVTRYKNWAPLSGVIADQYKYIDLPEPELYELANDPDERKNLYRSAPEIAKRLDAELEKWVDDEDLNGPLGLPADADRDRLAALGYLTEAARPDSDRDERLDPKKGIEIEMAVRRIRARIELKELDRAALELEQLEAAHPDFDMPDFYDIRHTLARARGDETTAIAELRAALERFPSVESFLFKLTLYLFEVGRYDEMEEAAKSLLARNPRHSEAIVLRARTAEARGELDRALAHYRAALELEPESIPIRAKVADLLAIQGDARTALDIYDGLMAAGALDQDAEKLYKVAMLNARLGNLDSSESIFRRALAQAPGGVHHFSFAMILARNGKPAEARQHLETALGGFADELSPQQQALARGLLDQLEATR